ncbi:hypothetical protein [Aureibacillus halotolerans]|uniref:Uncharacterized protein n=1 Tax=Aureibacillus halotolerans TaxID=1508390 RepID=A0A4R6U4Q7_9BACI|nr:hypothetical protein [Aureibacillus halotolerans]TDQ41460.1 hypothetical protein EV213_10337 [Aureibacillus halotolerans]
MQSKTARLLLEKRRKATEDVNGQVKRKWVKPTLWTLSILVWGGITFGGYKAAEHYSVSTKTYVDQQLASIQEENTTQLDAVATSMTGLKDELVNVQKNLAALQTQVEATGQGLSGNDDSKAALQTEIDQLNQQLQKLQQSLARLEEASNG